MAVNLNSNTATPSSTYSNKFEPGLSFLNLALPNSAGSAAKLGSGGALRASEPIMQKLHNAFLSGDKTKIAKAEAWIRANIVIDWKDGTKVAKTDTTTYDFE